MIYNKSNEAFEYEGVLYMEAENEREETDRIKIYDSKNRYLEYLPLESVSEYETVSQYCNKVIRRLEECETVEEIVEYLGIESYTIGTSWTDLLEDIYKFDGYEYDSETEKYITVPDGEEITERKVLDNDWVNRIGDNLILNCKEA